MSFVIVKGESGVRSLLRYSSDLFRILIWLGFRWSICNLLNVLINEVFDQPGQFSPLIFVIPIGFYLSLYRCKIRQKGILKVHYVALLGALLGLIRRNDEIIVVY
jgi:hypothetical protein